MTIRVPLFVKVMLPLVVLIIVTVGLSGYRVYHESTERFQSEMDTRLEHVALLAASTISPTVLLSIREPVDLDGPEYENIAQQLESALTAGNLAWVGIYYREGDYFYYWVDADYTGVSYPFLYPAPGHFAAYEDQQAHRVQYTDEYGMYYGFVAPILVTDEEGQSQVLGLVEAVLAGEATNLLQQDTLDRVWPILLGGSAIAVVLSMLVATMAFNRPLRRLQHGALALAGGKFGHTIDLRSNDELGELAGTFNEMSSQLERLYHERAESERMQRELEIARNVQQALFPAQLPYLAGIEVAAYCLPHRETSGDFYDVLVLAGGQMGVVVGDVSGKSIPAAMMMVAAHSTIRSEAFDHESPAFVLNESNRMLSRDVPRGMFVAASYATLDVRSRRMVWANAGQIYPFLLHRVRPAGEQYPQYLETMGAALPLGMTDSVEYSDHCLDLQPGDTVLFYTDGVVEAMNPARELYGFERLEALARSLPPSLSPQALIDAVLADVNAFVGPAEQHDDITLVAVRMS
ncbi:MAG: SpoIIE family protein phosphatase [Thermoflexales bacterium]|nr:SpoIIE family protein phosphatase [Thermoflexales bacterium]